MSVRHACHLLSFTHTLFVANPPTPQVTLRLISVIPAALLIFAGVKVSRPFAHAASSRRLEPTALVHSSMRASLREIERLLTSSRQGKSRQVYFVLFVPSHETSARGRGKRLHTEWVCCIHAAEAHESCTILGQVFVIWSFARRPYYRTALFCFPQSVSGSSPRVRNQREDGKLLGCELEICFRK